MRHNYLSLVVEETIKCWWWWWWWWWWWSDLHCEQSKTCHQTCVHIFAKYWQIL